MKERVWQHRILLTKEGPVVAYKDGKYIPRNHSVVEPVDEIHRNCNAAARVLYE